ncbi:MAG: hypothetical protein KA112_00945 [Alphaproteobacteria bacterium]|jgi:hypothetical protein|nr:hypothetical protein [Alphaproteobacteria bacterium]
MIKNYLKGPKIFFLLVICAVGSNMGPLSAANQCLDADSIRSAFKTAKDEFGWKYVAPLLHFSMKINSQNYLRVLNPDGISVATTQNADGKCHHALTFSGLLIGNCNLTKSDLYEALAKLYKAGIHKTEQGKSIQLQNLSPDMVILSEAQKSDDPGLCSYNLSVMGTPHEEL